MAAALHLTLADLLSQALRRLPTLADLARSMTSESLRDGSRFL